VSTIIDADVSIIWEMLTDAENFSNWNSTITSLEGVIEQGEKILLKSILDERRTFKLKVKELIPESRMVWGDGKGNRIHTLIKNPNGTVTFTMSEKISGIMFPMYSKYIPPFDEVFEQYVADLKTRAQEIAKQN
ncbi:MAG: SRPBCC domain-containing protein, partial [Ekhidna sp.]